MKIVVTHSSPDWDAITSVWVIKRFLPGWNEAEVQFVPAGTRLPNTKPEDAIETQDGKEIIHVDTGLGPLDHHQTQDDSVCGASLSWDFVKKHLAQMPTHPESDKWEVKSESIDRIVKVVVDLDHFKEVYWPNPTADYYEFSLFGVLEGIKIQKPEQDSYYVEFGFELLDALLHNFENRIWAEKEIEENGKPFKAKWGKGIAFETLNDTVLKLAQKMGYTVVVRKDPRKGYVRIKASPTSVEHRNSIDLTPVYERLKEKDPEATWFLHVSKRMLLNGTTKNPEMVPSKLSLDAIIQVIESVK